MWNEFYYWFKGNGKNETLPSEVFYCLAKSFEVVIRIILTWMEAVATNLYVALLCLHFILPKYGFYTRETSIRKNMVVNFFVYPRACVYWKALSVRTLVKRSPLSKCKINQIIFSGVLFFTSKWQITLIVQCMSWYTNVSP